MEIARRRLAAVLALGLVAGAPGCRRHRAAGPAPVATGALRGEVVDLRGGAIPGALVLAFSRAGAPALQAVTDAGGRFALEQVAVGRYRVLVQAAGFGPSALPAVEVPGPPVRVSLSGEGHALTGRVWAAGAVAAGARVLLSGEGAGPARETIAGGDGGFVLAGLGAGAFAVRATHGALASKVVTGTLDPQPGKGATSPPSVRLDLELGARAEGRVVDDRGVPLARAEIRVERGDDDPLPERVLTDAEGRFRIGPLPPGDYRVLGRVPGYIQRRPVTASLVAAAPAAPLALELVRGASLGGRVADRQGAPVPGATVRCLETGVEDLAVLREALPSAAEAAALPPGSGRALGSTRAVRTDAAGRFEIGDLLPGRFRLEVAGRGAVPLRTDELVLAPGQRRDAGTLTLEDGITVGGRVVDEGGMPVTGAEVTARTATGAGALGGAGLATITGAAGTFAVALAPGHYTLEVTAPGRSQRAVPIDVARGAAPAPVEVKLARADGRLEGVVRDDGGRPLARARVVALDADAAAEATAPQGRTVGSATTDAGGHFTIARVPLGPLLVEVRHSDYAATTVPAASGTLAVVTVAVPGRIDGEVRERSTGAIIAKARVSASGPDGRTATAAGSRAGAFALPRLVPGRWWLTATASGFNPAEREVEVPPATTPGEPSVRDLRLELEPAR